MENILIAVALFTIVIESAAAGNKIDRNVRCQITNEFSYFGMRDFQTCLITQNIEHEDYYLESDINPSIELFIISKNREVKYLPRDIGVKLPNLKQFKAEYAGLTIIRDFNLKKMRSLQFLGLYHNDIKTIEPKAFVDLVNVDRLHLDYNKLETLDKNLFTTMVALQYINLNHSKINFLNPFSFEIPNGELKYVELMINVCLDRIFSTYYLWKNFQYNIRNRCSG